MAFPSVVISFLFALSLAHVHFSSCHAVKGSISCLDCAHLSGIRVAVKCKQDERLEYALTDEKGQFKAQLPTTSSSPTSPSPDCLAMILGGPQQLCSSKKSLSSKIVKAQDSNSYTITTPLTVFSKCPSKTPPKVSKDSRNAVPQPAFESSLTIDLPLPPEWGLAPSSYYLPFVPIIGIP